MDDMNYDEAIQYIEQLNSKGIVLGLERMERLLGLLACPQRDLRCIHVAGTNGKGSVCAFLEAALCQAGLKVGRYSSPTLYDYRERIQVNGKYIEKQALAELITRIQQACARMEQDGLELPTVFEVETVVAFLYFAQQQCDYVLLEVGMGGRLDSTNVIEKPVLSVITPISLDHTKLLGSTLAEIAAEKGGIIKHNCPVVIGPQQREVLEVLQKRCQSCGVVPRLVKLEKLKQHHWSQEGQIFSYGEWESVHIRLLGDYQCVNAAIALEALQCLQQWEVRLRAEHITRGLALARWPGRFEVIGQKPLCIVDGAHNLAGAQALVQTLQRHFSGRRIWLLLGVFRDKDYRKMGEILSSVSDNVCCFKPPTERGLEGEALAQALKLYYTRVTWVQNAAQAVQQVLTEAEADDLVVSCGSLSTICDVQNAVKQWEAAYETH